MITQNYLKSILHYNPETGVFIWINSRRGGWNGKTAGRRDGRYFRIEILKKGYLIHRLAWLYMFGYIPECIDHINGDTSDNRIQNLRVATRSQNSMNQKLKSNSTSGIKGVHWHKVMNKWMAHITINQKLFRLGYFDDIDDAEKAVIEARNRLHGEFANHGEFKQ